MSRILQQLLLIFFVTILGQQECHTFARKDLYVSRHYGNDSRDCGSKEAPCRTLARGVQIADQNDRILLDGSFTKSDPYNCGISELEKTGKTNYLKEQNHSVKINVSLEITGYPSTPAYISCYDLLVFTGPSSRRKKMKVNFTDIVFTNTSMVFVDSDVSFVNCSFLQSFNPVQVKFHFRQSATVVVKSSLFTSNTGCIRAELSKNCKQVAIDLNDVNFTLNKPFSENEGSGISVYSTMQTIVFNTSITISCKNVIFSNNEAPLITNNAAFSERYEFYQQVKFIKNTVSPNTLSEKSLYSASKGRNIYIVFNGVESTGNAENIRCVQLNSSAVKMNILNSQINGHTLSPLHSGAGVLVQAASSIHVLIKNSSFKGNKGAYNGGVVAFQSFGGVVNLTAWKSNFTNNSALNGGAFSINSRYGTVYIDLEQVSFQACRSNFTGGALSIVQNKQVVFRASSCSWGLGAAAQAGSSIYIAPIITKTSNTSVSLENCKFFNNDDGIGSTIFVQSIVGLVEPPVFQPDWSQSSPVCKCSTSIPEVNESGCTGPAFRSWPFEKRLESQVRLHFKRCVFGENKGGDIYVISNSSYLQLTLDSIKFVGKKKINPNEHNALLVKAYKGVTLGSNIVLNDIVTEEFVGSASMILKFMNDNAKNTVTIKNSIFRQIRSYYSEKYHTETSPLSIVMPVDDLTRDICSWSYLTYQYQNAILIENTSFVDNIGRVSGGLFLANGNITIRYCTFINNFAINSGGHIHITDRSASVRIEKSSFKQESQEMVFKGETFVHDSSICSESTGQLLLRETNLTTDFDKDSYRLFSVSKAGIVEFDNSTKLQCAVGSSLRFDNFSHFIIWPFSNETCKLKVTVIILSCHQCLPGLYSLERGEITAPLQKREVSSLYPFCLPCPDHGANCSRNIEAKPNFWGYLESNDPPTLKFVHCPPHYCKSVDRPDTGLSIYNSCQGNRGGVMCGRCMPGYTENLFSKKCTLSKNCKDPWIWLLMSVYTLGMALFFIHNPPILQFLIDNALWCKKPSRNGTEYQDIDQPDQYNKGYTKITFYFYQIASYLTFQSFTEVARQAHFISFFTGLFNFQTKVSRGHFGCPFPGLTVVTKEMVPALGVLATLFNIQIIHLIHFSFNKFTGRSRPAVAPYYAATLKTLLLGYATTANTALKLLTCIDVLGESRLYYDANIKCWEWWQYLSVVYVVACLLPFIAVIYWGAMKLQRDSISVQHFMAACFFPLGFISFWLIQKLIRSRRQIQRPGTCESSAEVLKVLHDPFRPPSSRQIGSLYWESVMIGRRFLLLSYQVFFPDPLLRLFFMDITCLLVFTCHVATKPFRDNKANVVEAVSLACLVVIATINLIQGIFLSAGVTPQGSVERNLIVLQQVEICLLGIVPLLLVLLCAFAIASQVARVFVILFRKLFRFVLMRRIRVMGQY